MQKNVNIEIKNHFLQETSLKRPYPKEVNNDKISSFKRRATDNFVTLEVISFDDNTYQNVDIDYPNYITLEPNTLDPDALNVPDVYELNNDALSLSSTDHCLNFQDIQNDQLSSTGIDENQGRSQY